MGGSPHFTQSQVSFKACPTDDNSLDLSNFYPVQGSVLSLLAFFQ